MSLFHCAAIARAALIAAAAIAVPATLPAQTWKPERAVKIVVPFAAGAAADNGFRTISEKLGSALGQPIVIENRPGAGGILGAQIGAQSAPDGLTLIGGSDPPFTINPHLQTVPFDPLKDFIPVSLVANLPMVLAIRADLGISSVKDLLQRAKASPGKLTIASSGNGSSGHIAAESLKSLAKIDMLHVPYKGQPQAVADVVGGFADMTFSSLGPVAPHVQTGKLRLLAISTDTRLATLPDLATVAEAGVPGFNMSVWLGLLVPAGTPAAAVQRISTEVDSILKQPDVAARYRDLGYMPIGGPPERLAERIRHDHATFGKLIREAGIKP